MSMTIKVWPPEDWCAEVNPDATHLCDLPKGHAGDHSGVEMPTIVLDERVPGGVAARKQEATS